MKCKQCGSSEIERDPARGDAVCTSCGTVLEDNIIVAEVEFQEGAGGSASAIGQFVSAETKGGATGFGSAFNVGVGQESREITIRKARHGIIALSQQLRLNQQCIEMACNFFKMALSRHLTKGRPAVHIHAACVYITCRTEGTAHLLIDISDALNICCYQLGRTYFRLSRALCINIPSVDPCLYILRFAAQLEFGEKTHEVSMTALRLVQRMKRDSIHSGRRPSGLCGAALLIAARLHEYSRSPADVVRVVKVHESTLRKRLVEFGETPSSALTLDEFMTVDLEEEQDPPAFRAARKRDKERLQKLLDEEEGEREMSLLQLQIDKCLEATAASNKKRVLSSLITFKDATEDTNVEKAEAAQFAAEETLGLIEEIASEATPAPAPTPKELGPDMNTLGLTPLSSEERQDISHKKDAPSIAPNLDSEQLAMSSHDEEDIDSLIFGAEESARKSMIWHKTNATYLKEQKIKEDMRAKEVEENKHKKKKVRGNYKKKTPINANSAGEAIEKMLQEKRISSKINYDILKSLTECDAPATPAPPDSKPDSKLDVDSKVDIKFTPTPAPATPKRSNSDPIVLTSPVVSKRSRKKPTPLAPPSPVPATPAPSTPAPSTPAPATPLSIAEPPTPMSECSETLEAEAEEPPPEPDMESLASHFRADDDQYYDYEEY